MPSDLLVPLSCVLETLPADSRDLDERAMVAAALRARVGLDDEIDNRRDDV